MSDRKTCAYCRALLFEEDDVVVCPDCGASHHRDCWNQLNHCANEHNHGLIEETEPPVEETAEEQTQESSSDCPNCGAACGDDAVFCQYCGYPLRAAQQQSGFYGNRSFDPYGGVGSNDTIDGVDVSTVAAYVRTKTNKYIPDFKKMEKKPGQKKSKKVKWNWSAFLFGYLWLFFRKCHKAGWVAFAVSCISTILQTPLTVLMNNIMSNVIGVTAIENASYTQYYQSAAASSQEIMEATLQSASPAMLAMMLGGMVLTFIIHLVIGLFGEYFYKNDAIDKIKEIRESDTIENKNQLILARGGVNLFMPLLAYYLMSVVETILFLFF